MFFWLSGFGALLVAEYEGCKSFLQRVSQMQDLFISTNLKRPFLLVLQTLVVIISIYVCVQLISSCEL